MPPFLVGLNLCTWQEYCKKKKSPLCVDQGEDWGAVSSSTTGWIPKADAVLGPGAGAEAGKKYSCSCLKNCQFVDNKCTCQTDKAKQPVGSDNYAFPITKKTSPNLAAGGCACACGGVIADGKGIPEEEDYSTGTNEGIPQRPR